MAGPFESVTRHAIEEIILNHTKESKFGYILTKEAVAELGEAVYDLLVTSRSLKAAGDRLLTEGLSSLGTGGQRPKHR